MKKVLFPILALVLAFGLAIPTAMPTWAHTEGDPYTTDLLAGQDNDVGDVLVWNDGDNIYVKYVLDAEAIAEGWEITETHLYVGKTDPNTLTTAPGQFPYDDEDADPPGVPDTEVTYVIPLEDVDSYHMLLNKKGKPTGVMVADGDPGIEACNDIYIAAHAVVEKCETEAYTAKPTLTWQRSAETEGGIDHFPGYGGQWTLEQGFAIALNESQTVWDNGAYHTPPGTPTGSYASWNYKGVVGTQGPSYDGDYGSDLRRFQAEFTMPEGCTVTGGELSTESPYGIPINDNVYVFINEDLIFWGGTRANGLPQFQGMTGIQALRGPDNPPKPAESDRWYIPGTLPALTNLTSGPNYIDVFTEENERWGGTGELFLSLECEITTCQTETAWGDGNDFDHPNWAMYFTYDIQCEPPVLVNGGFEDPDVGTSQGWDIYDSGTTGLGWTVEWHDGSESYGGWTRPDSAHLELHLSGTVVNAYQGEQYAELDTDWDGPGGGLNGEPASVRIYQDINTCDCEDYTVSFAWLVRPGYDCTLEVYWGGSLIDTYNTPSGNTWNYEEIDVGPGASGMTETRLEFIEKGNPDSFGMFLDAVSVTFTPE